jgi:hypothetical protein
MLGDCSSNMMHRPLNQIDLGGFKIVSKEHYIIKTLVWAKSPLAPPGDLTNPAVRGAIVGVIWGDELYSRTAS